VADRAARRWARTHPRRCVRFAAVRFPVPDAIPSLRRAAALVALLGLPAALGCGGGGEEATVPRDAATLLTRADHVAAMVPLAEGGLRLGERLSGRVLDVDAEGRSRGVVARVPVSTEGQRGLIGLAVDEGGRTFATWTRPDGRIVVGQVAPGRRRIVWRGPRSTNLANGGTLRFDPGGGLIVGIGDLEDRARLDDPASPNGKLLRLDPDGPADQDPEVVSGGWNNPYAFALTPSGDLWVADNSPGDAPERLARGDRGPRPADVTELEGTRAPAGLEALGDDELVLCGFVSRRLERFRIEDGRAVPAGEPLARDCALGVRRLADGRLAYSTREEIRVVGP
jgi:hypothetical protein